MPDSLYPHQIIYSAERVPAAAWVSQVTAVARSAPVPKSNLHATLVEKQPEDFLYCGYGGYALWRLSGGGRGRDWDYRGGDSSAVPDTISTP